MVYINILLLLFIATLLIIQVFFCIDFNTLCNYFNEAYTANKKSKIKCLNNDCKIVFI